ncbi:CAP domain-containing protein [Blastococcus sp. TF02A-30]|nr:CAP domain-containing protein [Blastococcus sp. TF02A-30]
MGIDGKPTSSHFASASASVTVTPEGTRTEATGRGPANPDTGAGSPSAPVPPAETTAAPAPAETPAATVEEPAPAPAPAPAPDPEPAPAPAPAPVAAAVPAGGARESQVLAMVNQERAAVGCGAVSADAGLARVAAAHSADMRDRGFFAHTNLSGLDPFDRARAAGLSARAENIAQGQPDAAAVMDAWMNSSGHRANILDCSLTRLGVGIADGGGGPWWTQLFG